MFVCVQSLRVYCYWFFGSLIPQEDDKLTNFEKRINGPTEDALNKKTMAYYAGDGNGGDFGYCDPFAKGEEISS